MRQISGKWLGVAAVTWFLMSGIAQAKETVPDYSRAGVYPAAPAASGLPSGPGELAQMHPGLYADYEGEMFGEGAYYIAGPQQPLAELPVPDLALKPALAPQLRLVALVHTGQPGTDAFDIARRLGAEIAGIPVAFRELPKPPRGVRTTALSMQKLKAALVGKVDVILVNKLILALPEEAQELILKKVEAGAGLVVVGPLPATGPLMQCLPVQNPGQPYDDVYRDFRKTKGNSWLTGGVAFALWPGLDEGKYQKWKDFDPRCANLHAFTPKADAKVAAELEGKPLIITGQIGQGRVVVMAYSGNRWDGSYIPLLSAVNDFNLLDRAKQYQEQMYSLVERAALYAAAGEPAVKVRWPENGTIPVRSGKEITMDLTNATAAAVSVTVRFVLRDGPTWEELARQEVKVTVPAGGQAAAAAVFPAVPAVATAGGRADPLLEVQVRNAQNQPLDWGTLVTEVQEAQPPQVTVKADTVYPGEKAELEIESSAAAEWQATDLWGRVLAAGRTGSGKSRVEFTPDFQAGLVTVTVDVRDAKGNLTGRAVRPLYTPMFNQEKDFFNLLWPRGATPWVIRDYNGSVLRRQGGISASLTGGHFNRPYDAETVLRSGQRNAMTNAGPRFRLRNWPLFPKTRTRISHRPKSITPAGSVGMVR